MYLKGSCYVRRYQTKEIFMQTTIKNFYVVEVIEDETQSPMGTVLYGEVVADETGRFEKGSFVCSSLIISIDPNKKIVTTESASQYLLSEDTGKKASAYLSEVPLLREGYTPSQLKALRTSSGSQCNSLF